jgi:N-acetylglucosaminyl-diphospho-decaprenol L-rhamnosyltransferase
VTGNTHSTVFKPSAGENAAQSSSADAPDVSVVIVSWNVRELLLNCIDALRSSDVRDGLSVQIIVVDNASSDGSAEAVANLECVRLIQAGRNLGYGRAANLGLASARGRHFIVLNADTIAQPGSLAALAKFQDRHPRAGIVAPRLLNPDGSVQTAAFHFPTLPMAALDLFPLPAIVPGRIRQWLQGSRINGRYPNEMQAHKPFPIDHPLGACIMLSAQAYRDVGGFDSALFMYSEEVDLAIRYAAVGWECWQVPKAQVVHLGGKSTGQLPDRMAVELWRSRLYVYRKYYSRWEQALLRLLLATAQGWELFITVVGRTMERLTDEQAKQRRRRALALLRLALRR